MSPLDSGDVGGELDAGWYEPYDVTCARCGLAGTSATFIVEEGDEWECPECWERCEAQERQESRSVRRRKAAMRGEPAPDFSPNKEQSAMTTSDNGPYTSRLPSDDLQHIAFEGCDVCVIAPEDYDELLAEREELLALIKLRLRGAYSERQWMERARLLVGDST